MARRTLTLIAVLMLGCQSAQQVQTPTEPPRVTLVVKGMTCPFCATNLESQIAGVEGVRYSTIDLGTGNVAVWFDSPATKQDLRDAVVQSGFTIESVSEEMR